MVQYLISYTHPHRHFISFEARFPASGSEMNIQLPSWRPGRYELGNFAKNIRSFQMISEKGLPLAFSKTSKDAWRVDTKGHSQVVVKYEYYAADLNAGSSYLDEDQLYINPVNCFLFDVSQPNQEYELKFKLPEGYEIACGLKTKSHHILSAKDFDELADCPLIASADLRHLNYRVGAIDFKIAIQGNYRLDEERLVKEFKAFSELQVEMFGDIPCDEYLFLFQFTPFFVRHGVEHRNSTVIAMGPAADFMIKNWYDRLLGISCHELYHTWNIKNIRPVEMMPYDFTKENFSMLGYVAEGVTTYYGDLVLMRSNVCSVDEYLAILSTNIQEHIESTGRFNYSVAESSWDTWLDGYDAGIPWRKVSIYREGSLIAFLCDVEIMRASNNTASLDTAMRLLYDRFGKGNIGYTEADYRAILEEVAGRSFEKIFTQLVHGTSDYLPYLMDACGYLGLDINKTIASKWSESRLGFAVEESSGKLLVSRVEPDAPADVSGIWYGDEIIAVNGIAPYKNFEHLLKLGSGKDYRFSIVRKNHFSDLHMREDGKEHGHHYAIAPKTEMNPEQSAAFEYWKGRRS